MTQSELGKRLGASKAVVSSYETGIHQPRHETLVQLSRIFGVTMDYIYSGAVIEDEDVDSVDVSGLKEGDIDEVERLVRHLRSKNLIVTEALDAIRNCLDESNPSHHRAISRINEMVRV